MHANNVDEEATADFRARVARAIFDVQGLAISPADFIAYVRDDCGVLASHDLDRYRFFHLTFMEFLATCHARSLATRRSRTRSPSTATTRWREVIALAVTRGGLLDPLLKRSRVAGRSGLPRCGRWSRTASVTPMCLASGSSSGCSISSEESAGSDAVGARGFMVGAALGREA
ncbi:MAG: hypothetical protein U0326_12345 [Polyangiales bacterium]